MKILGISLILLGLSTVAMASTPSAVPEIDASTGVTAFALLSGGLLVLRARGKR